MSNVNDKFLALKDELIKDKEVQDLIDKYKLTDQQVLDAVPIFFKIIEERENNDTNYKTSLTVINDIVRPISILSEKGKEELYKKNILTNKFVSFNIDSKEEFIKDNDRKQLISLYADYIKGDPNMKGLYIYGDMGIGKTFISKRVAKKLAEKEHTVGFIDVPTLVAKVKQTFGTSTNSDYEELMNVMLDVDYLFLDDIGAEQITEWFRDEFLFSILNSRSENKKTTFFTSNYSQKDLIAIESRTKDKKYPQKDRAIRLIERIKALSKEIPLKGKNRRV